MTAAGKPDPRRFPSETGWLLALLATTVLINAWTMAGWLADPAGRDDVVPWTQMIILISPGLALTTLISRRRVKRSTPLSDTRFRDAGKLSTSWPTTHPSPRSRR